MAIFLDGINEGCQRDLYQDEMRVLVARAQDGYNWEFGNAVIYAFAFFGGKVKSLAGFSEPQEPATLTCVEDGRENELRVMYARTLAEREALCSSVPRPVPDVCSAVRRSARPS